MIQTYAAIVAFIYVTTSPAALQAKHSAISGSSQPVATVQSHRKSPGRCSHHYTTGDSSVMLALLHVGTVIRLAYLQSFALHELQRQPEPAHGGFQAVSRRSRNACSCLVKLTTPTSFAKAHLIPLLQHLIDLDNLSILDAKVRCTFT